MFSDHEISTYFDGVSFGTEIDKIKDKMYKRVLNIYKKYKDVVFLPSRWPLSLDLLDDVHVKFAVNTAFAEHLEDELKKSILQPSILSTMKHHDLVQNLRHELQQLNHPAFQFSSPHVGQSFGHNRSDFQQSREQAALYPPLLTDQIHGHMQRGRDKATTAGKYPPLS